MDEYIPHMPCMPATIQHRQRDAQEHPHYNACVARTVKPAKAKINAKARASMERWSGNVCGESLAKTERSEFGMRTMSVNGHQCGAMRKRET